MDKLKCPHQARHVRKGGDSPLIHVYVYGYVSARVDAYARTHDSAHNEN